MRGLRLLAKRVPVLLLANSDCSLARLLQWRLLTILILGLLGSQLLLHLPQVLLKFLVLGNQFLILPPEPFILLPSLVCLLIGFIGQP